MTHLIAFVASCLAVNQVVEILRHSELFAEQRAYAEVSDSFFCRLFRCPWCLSVWVGGFFATMFAGYILSNPMGLGAYGELLLVPALAFAFSRGANIINDVGRRYNRTPRTTLSFKKGHDNDRRSSTSVKLYSPDSDTGDTLDTTDPGDPTDSPSGP